MRGKKAQGFYETSKDHYKRLLLQTIMERGPLNRNRLAELLHLRPATQKRFIEELLDAGLVREAGNVVVRRGRGSIQLTVNPEGGRFIGVSLDERRVHGVLCSFDLSVLHTSERRVRGDYSAQRISNALFSVIETLAGRDEARHQRLLGIGYGEYGLVDMRKGVTLRSTYHRHWRSIPIRTILTERFDVPVAIESRERCSLLSERIWGAALDSDTAVWVEVADGIGLALLHRVEVVPGATGLAGEIGHMRVVRDGDPCMCGGHGCLETVASARAVTERVAQAIRQGIHSELSLKDGRPLTIADVTRAALGGDRLAYNVLNGAVYYLGVAIGNVMNLTNPDTVILQGDIFRHGGMRLLEILRREAESVALGELQEGVRWRISSLDDAVAKGAAALIFEALFGINTSSAASHTRVSARTGIPLRGSGKKNPIRLQEEHLPKN